MPGKAEFDPEATLTELTPEDTKEQQAFKKLRNKIITERGVVKQPSFLDKVVSNSMTSGWVELLTGEKLGGIYNEFNMKDDGVYLRGDKLNLKSEQIKVLSDFMARTSGQDVDMSLFDKVISTAASLAFDLPLMYLTGGIAGGIMKGGQVTSALMKATDLAPRFLGQVLQQSINFNLLGLPQPIKSLQEGNVGGALESVFHSMLMGTLAAGTGTAGVGIAKGLGKMVMKRNPAIREEFGGLAGSFGFGYLSGKMMGDSDEDAIATGLGFAATHFTNPRAYQRVIQEQMTKPLRIVTDKGEYINGQFNPDYFIEERGKLQQIDSKAFQEDGKLVPLDVEPLNITPEIKQGMIYYNEIPNIQRVSYGDALERSRKKQNGKKIYEDITKDLSKETIDKYGDRLRTTSEMISTILVGNEMRKTFGNWKIPDNVELRKDIVRVTNKNNIPYDAFKEWLVNDIKDYVKDPVAYKESLETYSRFLPAKLAEKIAYDPSIMGDMLGVMDKLRNTIMPNENLGDYNNRLLPEFTSDKIRLPNGITYAKPKPVIAEEVKSEQLKAGDTVKFESAGKEQTGKVKNFTDEYKNVNVELEDKTTVNIPVNKLIGVKNGKERMDKPKDKETNVGGKRAEAGSSDNNINVEAKKPNAEDVGQSKREEVAIELKLKNLL